MDVVQCSVRLIQALRTVPRPQLHLQRRGNIFCSRRGFRNGPSHQEGEPAAQEISSGRETSFTPLKEYELRTGRPRRVRMNSRAASAGALSRRVDRDQPYYIQQIQSAILRAKERKLEQQGIVPIRTLESSMSNISATKNESTQHWKSYDPIFLRDSCVCPRCVDPSTKQKNFQTSDIPPNIEVVNLWPATGKDSHGALRIRYNNDIPGFGPDHIGVLPEDFFKIHQSRLSILDDRFQSGRPVTWDKEQISKELQYVNYDDYMNTNEGLYTALRQLYFHGLLLVRGVPDQDKAVAAIANRIGSLRTTFYGRTWDVKSVPEAKNVAYTAQFLGLHMDLLYMADPPGFQFLHCLKNTCEGGSSLFSDSYKAVENLSQEDYEILATTKIPYHYRNAGEHYYFRHPVIEKGGATNLPKTNKNLYAVNYSPPFQAPLTLDHSKKHDIVFRRFHNALKTFADQTESENNLFEYRLQVGECVIFNNRRVLHGRRQFDAMHGERHLKGAYIDTDVFMSKWRVLRERWEKKELLVPRHDGLFVDGHVEEAVEDEEFEQRTEAADHWVDSKPRAAIKAYRRRMLERGKIRGVVHNVPMTFPGEEIYTQN